MGKGWSKIRTSCKLCQFSTWDNKRQTGCKLNRIYKYARRGADVVPCYDEESEFFVVDGRGCSTYRDILWANSHMGEDLEKIVFDEIKLNYTLFISLKGDNIERIINKVSELDIPPVKLSILNHSGNPKSTVLLRKYKKPWEEINIVDNTISDFEHVHDHVISNRVKSLIYIIENDTSLNRTNSLINKLNSLVNDDLRQIECITRGNEVTGGLVMMQKINGKDFIKYSNKNNIINLDELEY